MPQTYLHPLLRLQYFEQKGWGVIAVQDISADTLLECSPVIVMNTADRIHLDETKLHDYIFEWGQDTGLCAMAMGYVPIYNHASPSNAEYLMHLDEQVIEVRSVAEIPAHTEININYQGDHDSKKPVWFAVK